MRNPMLGALLALLAAAAPEALAQSCPLVRVTSRSRVCDVFNFSCIDSGLIEGSPAESQRSGTPSGPTSDLLGDAALTMDFAGFVSDLFAGGSTPIYPTGSNGVNAVVLGTVDDCLTFGGGAGAGRFHLPIHLTGAAAISYSASSTWTGPGNLAGGNMQINCFAFPIGGGAATPCDPPDLLSFTAENTPVDTTVELVVPFEFGQSVTFQLLATGRASVGYAANGDDAFMEGRADVVVQGALQPAYVTDAFGAPIAGATIASGSGFDYLTAPEPSPIGVGAGALAALAIGASPRRRRTTRTSPSVRPSSGRDGACTLVAVVPLRTEEAWPAAPRRAAARRRRAGS